jgi:hypothetical protein
MELMSTTLSVGFPGDSQKMSLGPKCSWCGLDGAKVRKISRRHLHAEARQEARFHDARNTAATTVLWKRCSISATGALSHARTHSKRPPRLSCA